MQAIFLEKPYLAYHEEKSLLKSVCKLLFYKKNAELQFTES